MFDLDARTSFAAVVLGTAAVAALLRVVMGREPVDLSALFVQPWELSWPRGVQEEELVPWRVDLARRPGRRAVAPVPATAPEDAACACDDKAPAAA